MMNELQEFKKYLENRESDLLSLIRLDLNIPKVYKIDLMTKSIFELNYVSCALKLITDYQRTTNY